ncbi:hypothetical protein, partial [Carboxylicivirga marina]|uniref:hypothetical protein n=1 Tax=Carboxylicivirga marina TaxID=2800988 RepID=UPI001F1A8E44
IKSNRLENPSENFAVANENVVAQTTTALVIRLAISNYGILSVKLGRVGGGKFFMSLVKNGA